MKIKNLNKKVLLFVLFIVACVPLVTYAATSSSGLAIAKYKLEGAQTQNWTALPISSTSSVNTKDISITKPGTTVVTLYAEDKAGNQNYQIKSFTIAGGVTDAPLSKIEYRLTGATVKGWTTYTGPFMVTNEGVTHLEARVYDEAGNITTVSQDVKLDKTSPVNAKAVITLD